MKYKFKLQWPAWKDYPCYECGRQWHLQWPVARRKAYTRSFPMAATLWSKSLFENLETARWHANTTYDGELKQQGDVVRIPNVGEPRH